MVKPMTAFHPGRPEKGESSQNSSKVPYRTVQGVASKPYRSGTWEIRPRHEGIRGLLGALVPQRC